MPQSGHVLETHQAGKGYKNISDDRSVHRSMMKQKWSKDHTTNTRGNPERGGKEPTGKGVTVKDLQPANVF